MRVLWFTNTPANAAGFFKGQTIGGGWMQSLNVLLEDKVELHVAFLNPSGPPTFKYGNTTYHSIMPSYWKRRLLIKSLSGRMPKWNEETNCYFKIINAVNPDLIHIHGTESGFIKILPEVNIPVLVSLQGILSAIQYKFNAGFHPGFLRIILKERLSLKAIRPVSLQHAQIEMYTSAQRERKYLRQAKYIAGRTDWDKAVGKVLAPNATYFHIDRILKEPFYNSDWTFPGYNNHLKIHTTTGNNPYKGIEVIAEALHELQQLIPEVTWQVAGIAPTDPIVKATRKKLGNRFPKRGLILMGKLNAQKLIAEMKKAHIYVMASHIENSPNNLAEAMMLGMPCIASMVGGTATYIENGVNGLLIQDGDPIGLAGTIIDLYSNKENMLRYGHNARKKALERHSKEKVGEEVIDTYNKIISY